MDDCIFCKIARGEIPSYKVYEDEKLLAFLDINPAGTYSGHTLLITKEHFPNKLEDLNDELLKKYFSVLKKLIPIVRKVAGVGSVNVLQNSGKEAGQLLDHFHFHIIPRGEGDNITFSEGRRDPMSKELEKISKEMKEEIRE